MNSLDAVNMPLEGYTLIEASAGTGKTYTITSLYLRLIMEEGYHVKDILVVTYTRAATEELRFKLRDRIQNALAIIDNKDEAEGDDFVSELVSKLSRTVPLDKIAVRLRQALLSLDESSVFTIHSFCQRMLREFAFESSAPLGAEVLNSDEEVVLEGCAEYVRKKLYPKDEKYLSWVASFYPLDNLPVAIFHDVKEMIKLPHPEIYPDLTPHEVWDEVIEAEGKASPIKEGTPKELARVSGMVVSFCKEVSEGYFECLLDLGVPTEIHKKFKKTFSDELNKLIKIELAKLDASMGGGWQMFGSLFLLNLKNLSNWNFLYKIISNCIDNDANNRHKKFKEAVLPYKEDIEAALETWVVNAGHAPEGLEALMEEAVLEAILRLEIEHSGLLDRFYAAFLKDVTEFVRVYARNERKKLSVITYDDMLVMLRDALKEPGQGKVLAGLVRRRYPSALIDEFQDTDKVQWEIFSMIYPEPAKSRLFLIGDPKQAIYGFRGADIFTYLSAADNVHEKRKFSLDKNWRSHPSLVGFVNHIFDEKDNPKKFVLDGIDFTPVYARDDYADTLMVEGDVSYRAAEVWHWFGKEEYTGLSDRTNRPLDEGEVSNGPASEQDENDTTGWSVEALTAAEIKRLISLGREGRAYFNMGDKKRSLVPGDITVLVRDFRDASNIREALYHQGVPSVYVGPGSVFSSPEAKEIMFMLRAVSTPSDVWAVCTALGSISIGYDASEIYRVRNEHDKWEHVSETFSDLREEWLKSGVMSMLFKLFQKFSVPKTLLSLKDGERRLTNMRQLVILLAEAEKEHPGLERLILWLHENIEGPDRQSDAQRLRLETDENLVKIMTYHKSKGLEFPVVFLPYLSRLGLKERKRRIPRYYDKELEHYICPLGEPRPSNRDITAHYKELTLRLQTEQEEPRDEEPLQLATGLEHDDFSWSDEMRLQEYAELVRLSYVALTRAKNKMYLCFPDSDSLFNSVPGQLLTGHMDLEEIGPITHEILLKIIAQVVDCKDVHCLFAQDKAQEIVSVSSKLVSDDGQRAEIAVTSRGELFAPRVWAQTSFSAMLRNSVQKDSVLMQVEYAHNISGAQKEIEHAPDIFSFPRGPIAGNCVHKFFENIDFGGDIADFLSEARLVLNEYDIDEQWAMVLAEMADNVVTAGLKEGINLKTLDPQWIAKEMNFVYLFSEREKEHFPGLQNELRGGVIKGFVDLVFRHDEQFFILDYKTNWLGASPEDYHYKKLTAAMDQHNYWLQAGIYSSALHRYLKKALGGYEFERHFGGVFYLFIRGVGHESCKDAGIVYISSSEIKERYPAFFNVG